MKKEVVIDSFWTKLEELLYVFKKQNQEELIDQINEVVNTLGSYDWEIGPWGDKLYFALSPGYNADLLDELESIIDSAPQISGWAIISGKPRKAEKIKRWYMPNDKGVDILVNAEGWRCVIYKFQDGTYDLDIQVSNLDEDEDTIYQALDIHLTNLLGEINYINYISSVNLVDDFKETIRDRSVPLEDIAKYVKI